MSGLRGEEFRDVQLLTVAADDDPGGPVVIRLDWGFAGDRTGIFLHEEDPTADPGDDRCIYLEVGQARALRDWLNKALPEER
jgi:hypothetical protein